MSDGSGRDSFRLYNNGGLSIPRIKDPKESTHFKVGYKYNGPASPRKDAKPFEYRSDGSGRDSYILHNSGGLKNHGFGTTTIDFFKGSLRSNEYVPYSRRITKDKSEITDYLNWITPKVKA
jgi:hypothetical protein